MAFIIFVVAVIIAIVVLKKIREKKWEEETFTCPNCGAEAQNKNSTVIGRNTDNPNRLCNKCGSIIPTFLISAIDHWTIDDYKKLSSWYDNAKYELIEFSPDYTYGNYIIVEVDSTHGLFSLKYQFEDKRYIYRFADINFFKVSWGDQMSSFSGPSCDVRGSVRLTLEMNMNSLDINVDSLEIASESTTATYALFGKYEYDSPERYRDFKNYFESCVKRFSPNAKSLDSLSYLQ